MKHDGTQSDFSSYYKKNNSPIKIDVTLVTISMDLHDRKKGNFCKQIGFYEKSLIKICCSLLLYKRECNLIMCYYLEYNSEVA